jgi:hypothetical protein
MVKTRGGAAMGGRAIGEEEDTGIGELFCSQSRFHCISQKIATQMTRTAASVYRSCSRLAPFVIDVNKEVGGDKKINRSDGCSQKWDEKNYCGIDRTVQPRASSADSLVGRVG